MQLKGNVFSKGFPDGSVMKNPPALKGRLVWAPAREDPLEEDMETHSSILAWKIPQTEKLDGLQSVGSQRVGHDWRRLSTRQRSFYVALGIIKKSRALCWLPFDTTHTYCNLQDMEKDREAWHAAVHRVAKSQTQPSDSTKTNTYCCVKSLWSVLFVKVNILSAIPIAVALEKWSLRKRVFWIVKSGIRKREYGESLSTSLFPQW